MQPNITPDDLATFAAAFDADPKNRLAANAVAQNDIVAVALNRESVNRINHTYSHLIETPEATNQAGISGRPVSRLMLGRLDLPDMKVWVSVPVPVTVALPSRALSHMPMLRTSTGTTMSPSTLITSRMGALGSRPSPIRSLAIKPCSEPRVVETKGSFQ